MTHRWPSEALLQAEAARIRSSLQLTELYEQLTEPPAAPAGTDPQLARGITRLTRLA